MIALVCRAPYDSQTVRLRAVALNSVVLISARGVAECQNCLDAESHTLSGSSTLPFAHSKNTRVVTPESMVTLDISEDALYGSARNTQTAPTLSQFSRVLYEVALKTSSCEPVAFFGTQRPM
jgi:hypothetical protein